MGYTQSMAEKEKESDVKKICMVLVLLVVAMAAFSQPTLGWADFGSRGWVTESGAPLSAIEKTFTDALSVTVLVTGITVSAAMVTWIVVSIIELVEEKERAR